MYPLRSRRIKAATVVAAAAGLLIAGCSSSKTNTSGQASTTPTTPPSSTDQGTSTSPSAVSSAGAQQTVAASATSAACTSDTYAGGVPKLDISNPGAITVGFSQSESTSNPFRATETKSITDEAKAEGFKLIQRNANANVQQQNTDIEAMIAQGAQFLIVAPENSDGLAPALAQAKAKHIPVLTIDRTVNGTACQDFIAFIGSNFLQQAQIAADDLGAALNGTGSVAILEGTSGNNVATDRTNGFKQELQAKYPNIKIVADQTANFDEATGQKVTEQFLQSNPDLTGIYAENDGMALGAIQAIKAAGKTPGKDIKIVSIDGIQQIVQGVIDGTVVADVETNPRFGPLAFESLKNFYNGTGVTTPVIIKDHHFTKDNAAAAMKNGDVY
jgi:galactofuranose transport system substrate-binding protein